MSVVTEITDIDGPVVSGIDRSSSCPVHLDQVLLNRDQIDLLTSQVLRKFQSCLLPLTKPVFTINRCAATDLSCL